MILCFPKSSLSHLLHKAAVSQVLKAGQQRMLNISCQVEKLENRGLIRVSGNDASSFLQGIVTNDLRHFEDSCKSIFAMFLNTKGRVLYDSIIYKTKEENTFYLECDQEGLKDLIKHLKMYRVRRKIDIDSIDEELKLWVIFNPKEVEIPNNKIKNIKQEQVVPCTFSSVEDEKGRSYLNDLILSDSASIYSDPRLLNLGSRVIAPATEDVIKSVTSAGIQVESSPWSYKMFRYRLGVGEGIEELPIGKCFPLEANCDYLHGVSFHKGCYIGQELTARTHHTGVIRKRLMPLMLHSEVSSEEFPVDTPIESVTEQKKTSIGKLRGLEKNSALGLMRIAEALDSEKFKIRHIEGETVRPFWWPQELPKERMNSGSTKKT